MLASIQHIREVKTHPNADALDIVRVLNYECIVKRDQYKVGDLIIFIEPDTVLPDVPWATFYNSKSNRVKAIRLRGIWSMGIVESFENVGLSSRSYVEGDDVSEALGVTKYEPPMPQDVSASGPYGFGIPKTDEERWQGLSEIPFGEVVDVTLKIDGQSFSAVYARYVEELELKIVKAIGGRSFLFKSLAVNNYTVNAEKHKVLEKLEDFCLQNQVNLCWRGESYGNGIQKYANNPHSKMPLGLAFFSTWLIDERKYATKGHPFYMHDLGPQLGLPVVPMLERNVVLTQELIDKYDHVLTEVNGQPFEGVVINWHGGSFKVINKPYDAKK